MGDAHRILVVDDELGPREALRMILKSKYQVMTAVNGPEALQVIGKIPPDLVLLDIKVRDMSGIEVLQTIKEVDPSIEVIMMTAYASLQTAREAMAHGASEYLIKPFSKKEVEEAVAKALMRRATRAGAAPDVRTLLDQLRTLAHTSTTAPATPAVDARATGVLAQLHHLLGAAGAALALRDNASAPWRLSLIHEVPPAARTAFDTPLWGAHLTQALTGDQPLTLQAEAAAHQPALPQSLVALGYTGALLCPLPLGPTTTGVLILLATTPQPWRPESLALAQTVAELLALALVTQQRALDAHQEATQQAQRAAQLGILRAIADVILSQQELPATLQALAAQLRTGLGYTGFHVWLASPPEGPLTLAYSEGPNPGWQPANDTPPPTTLAVVSHTNTQVVLAPLIREGRLMGVLKGVREGAQALLTDAERDLWAMLLDVIALAVHNAQLYSTLASTTRFLEHLIQGAGDAIVTVDAVDRVTLWNPAAERLFQAQAATMLGQSLATVLPRESYAACRAAVQTGGASVTVETHLTPPGSTPREVLLTLSPLQGMAEAGLSVIGKDVTAERQLREQQMQAEKWRAVGEMAAGIAHNFNNVLTTILTRAQLLMQPGVDGAALQRGLTLIAQAATDGASIVRRLQKLARSGGPAEVNRLDLNALVQEILETTQPLWQVQTQREDRPVTLELALTPLPRVAGRAAELREVLTNLLLNAVEAMPQGGRLTWRTWTMGGQVCVAVSDTGVGMSAEVQQRLFDPFYTTKGVRGTGLGLTVSQALIKGHYGTLTVDSTPGRGSTFTIILPGADEEAAPHTSQVVA